MTPPAPSPLALADDESGPWCAAARLACETWDLGGPLGRVFESCGLTGKQSVVFVLHHGRGLTFRAIATLAGTRSSVIFRHLAAAELKFRRRQAMLRLWATFNRLVPSPAADDELQMLDSLMRESPGDTWATTIAGAGLGSLGGRGFIEDLSKKTQRNVGIDTVPWRISGRPSGWRDRASRYDGAVPATPDDEDE